MDPTRTSLLLRVKDPRDGAAWREFHDLYAPLLYVYSRDRGLSHDDAEEVRSTCYEALVRQLPGFVYDRARGGFKAWLRTLVQRRVADLLRGRRGVRADSGELARLADPAPGPDELWEQAWRRRHLQYCVDKVRAVVPDTAYAVFRMLVDEDRTVPEVCERLGLNANQVYKAKSRVLAAIREEMALLDPDAATP
jgi:RNA polymerase sigma factor (sigma-70 family)